MKTSMLALLLLGMFASQIWADDGTISVPAFDLPESEFLDDEARRALKKYREVYRGEYAELDKLCPSSQDADIEEMTAVRRCKAKAFYKTARYKDVENRYDVQVTNKTINGVYTEIFTPAEGIAAQNSKRVLMNVHGGAFLGGSRTGSHLESIPIASVGKIKVVSVDYRMAPEYEFPAASEDVAAVYRGLLRDYKPENIGIFGCSAGGVLTAQSVAWFQKEGLPRPGAVGMLCAAAFYWMDGDSGYLGSAMSGFDNKSSSENPYFQNTDINDPLAFPGKSERVLAQFPPSLLISATRDFALSTVVRTHSQLVKLGVEADLHIWEGLSHAFMFSPDIPESREVYDVVVKFFDKHLGRN